MSSVRSGHPNAEWVKSTDTADDISIGTAKIKSGADYNVGKGYSKSADEATIDKAGEVMNIVKSGANSGVDKAKSLTDSASAKTSEGVDSIKSSNAWEQTKDIAGNVTNSTYNMGSDIIDAVKSGAEAGWNMVKGTTKD